MRNVNITNLRKNLFETINSAIEYNEIINVSSKNGNAIILSEEDYNGIIETINLLSTPGMKEKLLKAKNASKDDFVKIDWKKELDV